jgi:hypothetical protein
MRRNGVAASGSGGPRADDRRTVILCTVALPDRTAVAGTGGGDVALGRGGLVIRE